MSKRSIVLLVTILCLVVSSSVQALTRRAGCVLKVQVDPRVLELNEDILYQIVTSSKVLGQAVTDVLGNQVIEDLEEYLEGDCVDTGEMFIAHVEIVLPDSAQPKADEILERLTSRLRTVLEQAQEDHIVMIEQQLQSLGSEYEELMEGVVIGHPYDLWQDTVVFVDCNRETPLGEVMESLRLDLEPEIKLVVLWNDLDEIGVDSMDPVGLDTIDDLPLKTALDLLIKSLDPSGEVSYGVAGNVMTIATCSTLNDLGMATSTVELEMSLDELKGRQEYLVSEVRQREQDMASDYALRGALEVQIAELSQQVAHDVETDPVIYELEQILQIQTERYENLKRNYEAGRVSSDDLATMQETLAETRIRMAQQRVEVAQQKGGGRMMDLRNRLQEMDLDLSENEARLQLMKRQLRDMQTYRERVTQQEVSQDWNWRSRNNLAERMEELKDQLRSLRPLVVTVIGG